MGRMPNGRSWLGTSYSRMSAFEEPTGSCLPAANGWKADIALGFAFTLVAVDRAPDGLLP